MSLRRIRSFRAPRARRQPLRAKRLRFEPLEDRSLLTAYYTVTSEGGANTIVLIGAGTGFSLAARFGRGVEWAGFAGAWEVVSRLGRDRSCVA